MSTDLINRLRGIYVQPVNDGAGLLDGKDTFTRTFQTPPIQHEAASKLEEYRDALREVLESEAMAFAWEHSREQAYGDKVKLFAQLENKISKMVGE